MTSMVILYFFVYSYQILKEIALMQKDYKRKMIIFIIV